MEIILFSTDIATERDITVITPSMNCIRNIEKWTVDTGDCDKVLRVVAANTAVALQVESVLWQHGYTCSRMPNPTELNL